MKRPEPATQTASGENDERIGVRRCISSYCAVFAMPFSLRHIPGDSTIWFKLNQAIAGRADGSDELIAQSETSDAQQAEAEPPAATSLNADSGTHRLIATPDSGSSSTTLRLLYAGCFPPRRMYC